MSPKIQKSFELRRNSFFFFFFFFFFLSFFFLLPGGGRVSCLRACLGARLLPQSYYCPNLSEGADSVGGQLRGDKEPPFRGVTKSGREFGGRCLVNPRCERLVNYRHLSLKDDCMTPPEETGKTTQEGRETVTFIRHFIKETLLSVTSIHQDLSCHITFRWGWAEGVGKGNGGGAGGGSRGVGCKCRDECAWYCLQLVFFGKCPVAYHLSMVVGGEGRRGEVGVGVWAGWGVNVGTTAPGSRGSVMYIPEAGTTGCRFVMHKQGRTIRQRNGQRRFKAA